MTRRRARQVRSTLSIWTFTTVASTFAQHNRSPLVVFGNAVICLIIVLLVAWFYRRLVPRLRGLPLLLSAAIAGLAFLSALGVAVAFWIWLSYALGSRSIADPRVGPAIVRFFGSSQGQQGLGYAYGLILLTTLGVELIRRLGKERLASLLLGRYRNPKEERRVFLLLDLRDSTPLAEALGSVRFSGLLRDLFRDITEPIVDAGGEVVGYVGDEAIVSWSERRGLEEANALRCFRDVRARVAGKSAAYRASYGVVPRLKGAIHLGPVVVTEVGELRTDVAFHGDALNTATRILDECGPLGAELLLSESTASRLPALAGIVMEPLGAFGLRGKGEPIGLVRAVFVDLDQT